MSPRLVSVSPDTSIYQAAQKMTSENVASLMVMDGDKLVGVFTDKDCRKRVIAKQIDVNAPISDVMTKQPITIDHASMVHEASITMSRHQIKHLPVVRDNQVISMVTLSDLIRLQRADPVLIIDQIHKSNDVNNLKTITAQPIHRIKNHQYCF